jgi:8-oxo-dGTP pyrophosphatase MutT (NUDIX family)
VQADRWPAEWSDAMHEHETESRRGPWRVRGSEEIFQDAFLRVVKDQVVQPDGEPGSYTTVDVKHGVAILACDDQGRAVLVRQFRYALGRESLEVVAGGLDEGEEPQAAAARELHEEVGATAAVWESLGLLQLDTSIVRCPVHLFLARGLSFGEPEREGTEQMASVRLPFDEAVAQVLDGTIIHAPSVVAILRAQLRTVAE